MFATFTCIIFTTSSVLKPILHSSLVAKSGYCFVTSVRLSTRISAASTGRISLKFEIGDLYEKVSRYPKFGYSRTKKSGTLHEDLGTGFLLTGRHKVAIKHCCATFSISILLTVTCTSTVHTERIVAFILQQ